jgi:hypothetical protein
LIQYCITNTSSSTPSLCSLLSVHGNVCILHLTPNSPPNHSLDMNLLVAMWLFTLHITDPVHYACDGGIDVSLWPRYPKPDGESVMVDINRGFRIPTPHKILLLEIGCWGQELHKWKWSWAQEVVRMSILGMGVDWNSSRFTTRSSDRSERELLQWTKVAISPSHLDGG